MRYLLIVILLISYCSTQAQSKQDYVWLFGLGESESGEQRGYKFDFNQEPYDFEHQDIAIAIGSTNTSISDIEGNLLFFTNGCIVYNKDFVMMENGDNINENEWNEIFNENCIIGYVGSQDVLIVRNPILEDNYYIIHKPRIFNGFNEKDSIPIHYSVVDLGQNDGRGKVIEKNKKLHDDDICLSSYLTGIHHANQSDFWFIQPIADDSVFVTYLISENGIEKFPDQNSHQYFERGKSSASGTSKFSPDGTKYAMYNETDGLLLYDFDRSTGELFFREKVITHDTSGFSIFCSVEWSPNSRFVYTATKTKLHQVDIWEDDIQADGIRLIDTYNGTQDPLSTTFFLMAQAPNCKIYMCPTNGTNSYHVINHPDELGTDCDFVQNGVKLPHSSNAGSMPNFPRFRVDEEEKCDPTIVSVFGDAVYYRRDLDVYPNPSTGLYFIDLPEDFRRGRLIVTDINAQILSEVKIDALTFHGTIELYDLTEGIYNIEIYPDDNRERVFYGRQVVKF